jgi:hypothetical protein
MQYSSKHLFAKVVGRESLTTVSEGEDEETYIPIAEKKTAALMTIDRPETCIHAPLIKHPATPSQWYLSALN